MQTLVETAAARKMRIMAELESHPYRPAPWLPGPHFQSAWGPMVRKHFPISCRRERWTTPDDDFLDVLFLDGRPGAPVVFVLHGLEGAPDSFYIRGLAHLLAPMGWHMAVMMFRSCSGEINRAPRLYHLGETQDARWVLHRLAARYPDTPIFAAGISLGANVLIKLLSEAPDQLPEMFQGAAALSPPFDVNRSAPGLHRAMGGYYVYHFLKTLIPKAELKHQQYPGHFDIAAVRRSRTFYQFDSHFTAPIHGYKDAEAYWRQCSCGRFIARVQTPTLLVCAENDPFIHVESLPRAEAAASPWLFPLFPTRGGHVGFVAGPPWRCRYWGEEQAVRFFTLLLESL